MDEWRKHFRVDPLPVLAASDDDALHFFIRRDLLEEHAGPAERLWRLPEAQKTLNKQQQDGSWPYSGKQRHPAVHYQLVETWRQFRVLVEQYGFTRENPQACRAAEFLFTCQTGDGDFRGFLANQYATYYTGAILSLLVKAGFEDDPRVEKCFQWLLWMRQQDGGWTIPILTHRFDRQTIYRLTSQYETPVEPDRSLPFSHNWTGMVLRAFAAHPRYRQSEEARAAAGLLKTRFFQPDVYTSYQAAGYWVRFEYPFWWNNLVAALDSVSWIQPSIVDEPIEKALSWLVEHQGEDGLWKLSYAKPEKGAETTKAEKMKLWVALAICRIFKRFYTK